MHGILVDSNIIIDILTEDKHWFSWSSETLEHYANTTSLFINKIIYSEVSLAFNRIEDCELALPSSFFTRSTIPWEAAFLAGKVFLQYRQRGGSKTKPLPDFFIGAHASIAKLAVMTRDSKPYKSYFPNLQLITPK
ncbi:MAG: type II toxin-antitoxin system VapC family toxin [Coxiellaceae bacterium]|nr:type II toxin-antitoxin system VapC family toxin [Coxiellaceae bacterium]